MVRKGHRYEPKVLYLLNDVILSGLNVGLVWNNYGGEINQSVVVGRLII